jgi:hypothetical protein
VSHWGDDRLDPLPPEPDLEPLHERDYIVRAWKIDDRNMLLRGSVMDLKPGEAIAKRLTAAGGSDDGQPMRVHHMVVDMTVSFPELTITGMEVKFESHPQPGCPSIAEGYRDLIGLSIARGFSHKVRELFGGPRGCTHTTALLQAMSPVAVQSIFSMRRVEAPRNGEKPPPPAASQSFMRGTCHVWAEDGEMWQRIETGLWPPMPLTMQDRIRRAGLDPAEIDLRTGG